jgi:hypothetical protein
MDHKGKHMFHAEQWRVGTWENCIRFLVVRMQPFQFLYRQIYQFLQKLDHLCDREECKCAAKVQKVQFLYKTVMLIVC